MLFLCKHLSLLGVRHAAVRFPQVAYFAHRERVAADVVRRERIDLIHSHFGWPGGLGGVLVCAETDVPLVATLRGVDLHLEPTIPSGLRLGPFYDAAVRTMLRSFLGTKSAEPMNNRAEQALRAPVILRKLRFSSQSGSGLRTTERLLSVTHMCRQHQRNLLSFLTEAVSAHRQGHAPPTLLPLN